MAPSFMKTIGRKFDQIFGKTTHTSQELIDNLDRSWSGRARSGPRYYTGPIDEKKDDDEGEGGVVDYSGVPYSYTVEGAEGSVAHIRGTNSSSAPGVQGAYSSKRDSASSFDKEWGSRAVMIGEESCPDDGIVHGTCSTQGALVGSREYIVDGNGVRCRRNHGSSMDNHMQTPTEESFQHVVDSAEDVASQERMKNERDGKLVFDASVATEYLSTHETEEKKEGEEANTQEDDAAWNSSFIKRWKAERRKARLQALGVRSMKEWDNSTQSLDELPELLVNELPDRRREREDKEFDRDPSLATLLLRDAEVC